MSERRPSGPLTPPPALAVRAYGKYVLVRKLAEGGMAEIFLAKQVGAEGFERNVVIKRMLAHLSSVPDFVGMFLDEARLAARLNHPNIIQINDLGLAEGCYYISMEYLAGEDFSTVLRTASRRREYVPLHVVCRIIIDAANGLHFAHEFTADDGRPLNVVHRDVSPSNIYVAYQGQAKLLDFGIAKAESRVTLTTAGVVKGKYMYMSPEQAATGEVDRRADVFSLGVSLFEAVTNTRPFARDTDLAILNAVLKGDFQKPRQLRPDIPQELENIVLKAMSLRREDRYQTAAAMVGDLERFMGGITSVSGAQEVASYLQQLFGPERVAEKTRIPSLASLAQSGVDMPGYSNPLSPKTEKEALEPLTVGGSASRISSAPVSRRSALPLVFTAMVGLAAGAGALAVWAKWRPGDLPVPAVVTPPLATATAPDAGSQASALSPDAGGPTAVAAATPDAGAPSLARDHEEAFKPVHLTPDAMQRVLARHQSEFSRCFERFKADLGRDEGVVPVVFSIQRTGKVTDVTLEALQQTQVGQCLEVAVIKMKFPRNLDNGVRLRQPLAWRVQR